MHGQIFSAQPSRTCTGVIAEDLMCLLMPVEEYMMSESIYLLLVSRPAKDGALMMMSLHAALQIHFGFGS